MTVLELWSCLDSLIIPALALMVVLQQPLRSMQIAVPLQPLMREQPARNTTEVGVKLWVSHVYDAHSPLRPPDCDEVCASHLRMARLAEALGDSGTSRPDDDSWPFGQVSTGYIHRGALSEYFVELSVGNPNKPQPTLLLVDTGSYFSWMQCKPCHPCYSQAFPVFDPHASTTYHPQVPNSPYCVVLQSTAYGVGTDGGTCNYRATYVDGSGSEGQMTYDIITFWNAKSDTNTVEFPLPFGCGFSNKAAVFTYTSGILGLADQLGLSWPEELSRVYNYNPSFSFCFAPIFSQPNSGWLLFSDAATIPTSGIDYFITSTIRGVGIPGHTYVDVVDFLVNGQAVGATGELQLRADGSGGVIVDTGTMVSLVVFRAYYLFRDEWRRAMSTVLGDPDGSRVPGPRGFDTCWDYPNDLSLPDMGFLFRDGQVYEMGTNAKSLIFYSKSNRRRMCFPFVPIRLAQREPAMTWGSVSLHNNRIIVDKVNNIFGWQPDAC